MIQAKCGTTVPVKQQHWAAFAKLLEDQFQYGGDKYACSGQRESTDLIVEAFGVEWVLGTMMKYIMRFKNLQRPKDLLKVATYCYIVYLQMGYHLEDKVDTDTWNENDGERPVADSS